VLFQRLMSAQPPCAGSREIQLAAGETLIREGELGDTAYCILSGEVRVWKRGGAGEIELARLGPGAIFGEMSIVDEKPRSASITTLCDTRLKELKRAQFLDSFQHDPDFATSLLRVLFERLRETGAKLTELQQGGEPAPPSPAPSNPVASAAPASPPERALVDPPASLVVRLEGLTQPAREALPCNPFVIERLPCRIGRTSTDQLAYNDLMLPDFEPYQISVNHLLIFQERQAGSNQGRIGIFDRGSSRGSWLNDCPLGGLMGDDTATFLEGGTAELVLGDQDSVFRYQLSILAPGTPETADKG
jgi:CRP-like cAMP-binding protein